jgi:CBS domain-containing protein
VGADRALKALALHKVGDLELRPAADGPRVPAETTLRDALALLVERQAETLVVTDGDGRVLGSLTRDDLLR